MKDINSKAEHFLVCGLGNLGQHCVKLFHELGMQVNAIDVEKDINWQVNGIPDSIKQNVIVGDCQKVQVLEEANLKYCRTVLLVTSNHLVNLEYCISKHSQIPHLHITPQLYFQSQYF
jgi:Trk K+ transport system NAD-binding subunit